MKLSDLDTVRELKKSLDYVETLRAALNAPGIKIRIGEMHVRPDLAEYVRPAIEVALNAERDDALENLRALGVEA